MIKKLYINLIFILLITLFISSCASIFDALKDNQSSGDAYNYSGSEVLNPNNGIANPLAYIAVNRNQNYSFDNSTETTNTIMYAMDEFFKLHPLLILNANTHNNSTGVNYFYENQHHFIVQMNQISLINNEYCKLFHYNNTNLSCIDSVGNTSQSVNPNKQKPTYLENNSSSIMLNSKKTIYPTEQNNHLYVQADVYHEPYLLYSETLPEKISSTNNGFLLGLCNSNTPYLCTIDYHSGDTAPSSLNPDLNLDQNKFWVHYNTALFTQSNFDENTLHSDHLSLYSLNNSLLIHDYKLNLSSQQVLQTQNIQETIQLGSNLYALSGEEGAKNINSFLQIAPSFHSVSLPITIDINTLKTDFFAAYYQLLIYGCTRQNNQCKTFIWDTTTASLSELSMLNNSLVTSIRIIDHGKILVSKKKPDNNTELLVIIDLNSGTESILLEGAVGEQFIIKPVYHHNDA